MATVNNINNETISSSRYGAIGYMYKQSSNRGNDANIQASDTHSHAPIYPRKIFDKLHSKFAKAEDPKGIFNRDSEAVNDSPQCSPLTSTILNWNKILGKNARSKDMDDIGTVTWGISCKYYHMW